MNAPTGWQRATFLTLTEAAAVWSATTGQPCSRSLMYEWAAEGRIPTETDHLGRQRVRPAHLTAAMAAVPSTDQATLFDLPPAGGAR